MNLTINGEKANIALEAEETAGDLLAGIESWLEAESHCLLGISINGEELNSADISRVFFQKLRDISAIDIKSCPLDLMLLEALEFTYSFLSEYENTNASSREELRLEWEASPAAGFLARRLPELDSVLRAGLAGDGQSAAKCGVLVWEHITEIRDPHGELLRMQAVVENIVQRLEDLPLDLQTGKDSRAAETVRMFSACSEKLFRIMNTLKRWGISFDKVLVDATPLLAFLRDFSSALNELLAAYEIKDVVLVGDLAEYELAPRLRSLYGAFKELPGAA